MKIIFIILLTIELSQLELLISKRTFKKLNKEIKNLINNPDTRYDDKEILKSDLKTVSRMKILFNSENDPSTITKIKNEVFIISERILHIENETKIIQKTRLKTECLSEINYGRYATAANKIAFLILDDDMVDSITSEIYNGDEKNLRKTLNFIDYIPNIKLSFRMCKNVYNLIEKHNNFTIENTLLLWNSTTNNVFLQSSADKDMKSECFQFFEDKFQEPITDWIKELLAISMKDWRANRKKVTEIFDILTYDIKDFKILRDIFYSFKYNRNIFYQLGRFLRWSSDLKVVSKALMMSGVYDVFDENLIFTRALQQLIVVSTTALNAYNNGTEHEKKMFDSFTYMRSVKPILVRLYKKAMIHGFFNNLHEIEEPTRDVFVQSQDLFKDIINATIDQVKGHVDLVEIAVMFRKITVLGEDCIGYEVLYEKVKHQQNLTYENIGVLLALQQFIDTTLDEVHFQLLGVPIFIALKQIQYDIIQRKLKQNVFKILQTYLYNGDFHNNEHQQIWRQISLSRNDGIFLYNISTEYGKINFDTLIAYFMSLPLLNQRLVGLCSLLNSKIPKNSYELFLIARSHKIITENINFKKVDPYFIMTSESYKNKFPSSIRYAVFSQEVYIKNTNKSEYLEINMGNIVTNGKKISKWILEKTNNASEFKIKNVESHLYLQPGLKNMTRNVISGTNENYKWSLSLANHGVYIKSVEFDEYLFSKSKKDGVRFLYTTPDLERAHIWAIQEVFVDTFESMIS